MHSYLTLESFNPSKPDFFICQIALTSMAQMVKNLPQCRRPRFDPWVGKTPWRTEWLPTPVFLPREFHGQEDSGRVNKACHHVGKTQLHSLC